jgi:hypothetical protein
MIRLKLAVSEVVARWKEGETFASIAKNAGVSRAWVAKLVYRVATEEERKARAELIAKRDSISSPREFTGVILDEGVKDALRIYAQTKRISMSKFIAEAVEEKLDDLGVEIVRVPEYKGEPLPFEETK